MVISQTNNGENGDSAVFSCPVSGGTVTCTLTSGGVYTSGGPTPLVQFLYGFNQATGLPYTCSVAPAATVTLTGTAITAIAMTNNGSGCTGSAVFAQAHVASQVNCGLQVNETDSSYFHVIVNGIFGLPATHGSDQGSLCEDGQSNYWGHFHCFQHTNTCIYDKNGGVVYDAPEFDRVTNQWIDFEGAGPQVSIRRYRRGEC